MSLPTEANWRFIRDIVAIRSDPEPMKQKKTEVSTLLSLSARAFFKVSDSDKKNTYVDIDRARHFFSGNDNAAFFYVPEKISTYMKVVLKEILCTLDVKTNPELAMTVAKIQVTAPGGAREASDIYRKHNIDPNSWQRGQSASELSRVYWLSREQRERGLTYEEFIPFFHPAE